MADPMKGRRISGGERDTLGAELRKRYEAGASIRQLAEETGRSYGSVHALLIGSGAQMRSRGGATRKKVKK